jgi:septal ring factor EnvC (AmiA/AmiB activator)
MPLFWLALAVAVVAVVASSIYVTKKGLEAFRGAKRLSGAASTELERIEQASAQIEEHLNRAAESGSKLEAELERLRRSRAQLNVLRSAIDDVRASIGRVTAVYPRK